MGSRFEGKAVLVTGAGVGIGFAICQMFAREGALIALNDLHEGAAQQAAKTINHELEREVAFPYPFDVANVPIVNGAAALAMRPRLYVNPCAVARIAVG